MPENYEVVYTHPSGATAIFTRHDGELDALAKSLDSEQFWVFKNVKALLVRNDAGDLEESNRLMREIGFAASVAGSHQTGAGCHRSRTGARGRGSARRSPSARPQLLAAVTGLRGNPGSQWLAVLPNHAFCYSARPTDGLHLRSCLGAGSHLVTL